MTLTALLTKVVSETNKVLFEQTSKGIQVSDENSLVIYNSILKKQFNTFTASFRYLIESAKDIEPTFKDNQVKSLRNKYEFTKTYDIDCEALKCVHTTNNTTNILFPSLEQLKQITF